MILSAMAAGAEEGAGMPWYGILIWAFLIGIVVFFFIKQKIGAAKFRDADMSVDPEWLEKAEAKCGAGGGVKQYYMHPDKNYFHQGHILEDRENNVIYEEKVLYASVTRPFEVDFINHLTDFSHHHRIGHTRTSHIGGESVSVALRSTFRLDGEDVWDFLKAKGFSYQLNIRRLGYTIDVARGGVQTGTIYSTNNGKNYFGAAGDIEPAAGFIGQAIIECRDADLDGMFLMAVAFARTNFSVSNFKSKM